MKMSVKNGEEACGTMDCTGAGRPRLIITNNPKAEAEFRNREWVEFLPQADQREILRRARDRIHLGARLMAHPMAGQVKPHETPYRSVVLDVRPGPLDENSLIVIEDSIAETNKFLDGNLPRKYSEELLPELQFMDLQLLNNSLEGTQ